MVSPPVARLLPACVEQADVEFRERDAVTYRVGRVVMASAIPTPSPTPSRSPIERARRGLRALGLVLPALVIGVPPLAWVYVSLQRAALSTLGRDQGIFQYIAWALAEGDTDYRDVRDVNGPLTHLVHGAFLRLGGRDELRFHLLDFAVTCLSFACVGACLPGLAAVARPAGHRLWPARVAWGFAAAVALTSQHLSYIYWDLAQRETFCDWFLLPSVALQLAAQSRLARSRGSRWPLVLAGGLSAVACFGKPTFAAFSLAQLGALAMDRDLRLSLRARLAPFVAGGLLVGLGFVAWLLRFGDLGSFLTITFVDVPAMYRFMWPRLPSEIIVLPWCAPAAAMSLVTSAVLLGLIWEGHMPRRLVAIAVFPLVALLGILVQAKGFPYHFHPLTASLHLQWLVLVVWAWERFGRSGSRLARVAPLCLAAALSWREATVAEASGYARDGSLARDAATAEQRQTEAYFLRFTAGDFFPYDLRLAADFLRRHTARADRVQLYGMDPYLLFLAERRSATPYIYAYELNADSALRGAFSLAGLHPTQPQQERIRAMREAHETDLLMRLDHAPPAAFVFIDNSPLTTFADAARDFKEHCPRAGAWLDARYRESAVFGVVHVWMRLDLASAEPQLTP